MHGAVLVLFAGCARPATPPAAPAPVAAPALTADLPVVHVVPGHEPLVDATFDRDVFGSRRGPERAGPAAHRAAAFVLEHLRADAERCFAAALATGPVVVGATFLVEAGGRVTDARAEADDAAAAACLERALTARTFPDPGHNVRHRIAYDFVLRRH